MSTPAIASLRALVALVFLLAVGSSAQVTTFGSGCDGIFPAAETTFSGSLTPGKSAHLSLTGAPPQATVVLIVGVSNTETSLGAPLPLDLSGANGVNPGCELLISTEFVFVFTTDALGELDFGFKIPFGLGDDLYFQWAVFEESSPLSITLTSAIGLGLTNTVTPSAGGLVFDSTYVGDTASADLTLTNETDRAQTIEDVLVFETDASDFSVTFPQGLPVALAPGEAVVATVEFAPSMGGLREAALEIVHDGLPSGFDAPVVEVSGIAFEALGSELHVDAGGQGVFDSAFQIWDADFGSTGGFRGQTSDPIANTPDAELYQTWRYGPSFSYAFAVPDDDYEVELHFAEPEHDAAGLRVFDVFLEGVLVLADVDLFDEVGAATATQLVVTAPVDDGELSLELVASTDDAILSGIEVRRLFTGLGLSAAELDFGYVSSGQTATLPLLLTNTGTDTVSITSVTFDIGPNGWSGDQFELSMDGLDYTGSPSGDVTIPASATIAPGGSLPVDVTFQPSEHLSNEVALSFDGNFDTQTVELIGVGGSQGHPFLHVVIEGEDVWVDYDDDGLATVALDGSFSHTHEPGKALTTFEWTSGLGGAPLGSGEQLVADFALGQHTVCLEITDDNVPPEHLDDCFTFRVVAPDMVPGVLTTYFPSADPVALLDAVPTSPEYAEVLPQMRAEADVGVGGSPFASDVMVRMVATLDVTAAGDHDFTAIGGVDRRLELDGSPVTGPVALDVGLHTLEARFAVSTLADLPLEVTVGVDGGGQAPILGDALTHDETNIVPVINTMPSAGITLGGNAIDIQGLGFFPADDVVVHWGPNDLTGGDINVPDANSIAFSSPPAGAGVITVTVETPQGVSNTRLFEYDPAANPPINWTVHDITTVARPTQGVFAPDGTLWVVGRFGEVFEITLDDDYQLTSIVAHAGVSGQTPNHETLGLAINPYETDPLKLYVAHSDLYAQGGGAFSGPAPFVGQISVLEGPDYDTPVPLVTNLPTSNHDHGINGMFFDNNGDLFVPLGSNTNAGIKHPKSGDLPESPLTAALLKFETSKPDFDGDILYELIADGTPVDDQVLGEQIEIVGDPDVEVWASGIRNAYDVVYTTSGRIYATDNGPNATFGDSSTGPDTTGPPVGAPDEFLLVEPGNYYGHPNRSRGATDPRQNVYRGPSDPAIPDEHTPPLTALSSSTNGLTEYRADTFGGQMRGDLIAQRWNSTTRRMKPSADGRTLVVNTNLEFTDALDIVHGPGGALVALDYSGDTLRVLEPYDVAATGMTAYDIFPWRAPPDGGLPFVIGGANFGTLGDTTVQIGTKAATVTSVTSKRITGTLPAHANPTTDLLDVIVFSGGEVSIIADAFRFLKPTPGAEPGHWETRAPMPLALGEVAAGVVDGELLVVGEGDARTASLDVLGDTWDDTRAPRLFPGHHHGAEVVDGRWYLLSGIGAGSGGRVQIYDPVADSWTEGAAMPWSGGSVATAVIDGKIYAAGGIVGSNTVANAGVYDPVADSWTLLAPMPVGRNHAAAGTDGEKLYVFGGRDGGNWVANGFDDVQVYDPDSDTWTWSGDGVSGLAPLPVARGGMGKAIWWDGEFYVFGGETDDGPGANGDGVYDRVDVYDPVANTWRQEAAMPTARHGMFPVIFQSRMFAVGGGDAAGFSQVSDVEVFQRY